MKKNCRLFGIVLTMGSILMLSGCKKDPVEVKLDALELNSPAVRFPAEGGTNTVLIKASGRWTITNIPTLWYTISPLEGTGDGEITISSPKEVYQEKFTASPVIKLSNSELSVTLSISRTSLYTPAQVPIGISPVKEATNVPLTPLFQWTDASGSDHNDLNYKVEYSLDKNNWSGNAWTMATTNATGSKVTAPLTPNTTYYWRVTATDGATRATSEINTFRTTAGDDSWQDGESRVYQQSAYANPNAWTLVVTGDGFVDSDLVAGGEWEKRSTQAIEALFSVEPYKSYRNYLNVIRIGARSEEQGASLKTNGTETPCYSLKNTRFGTIVDTKSSAWCGLYTETYPGQPGKTLDDVYNFVLSSVANFQTAGDLNNVAILVIINYASYNGLVNYIENGNTTWGFVTISRPDAVPNQRFENIVVHEIGGHGIGHLADEYISTPNAIAAWKIQETLDLQARGFYANVDVSGNRETSPWKHFFTAPEYSFFYHCVGYFEGARSSGKGIWRPEESSCMQTNQLYFNGPSRESIVKRLKEAVGESHTWRSFVEKDYDRYVMGTKNLPVESPFLFQPLPEPTVWKR